MSAGLADLLACVGAFARALEGAFDPERFLDEFSARAQTLVPHDGMLIAYLEDGGRTFSAFARHVSGTGVALEFRNFTIAFDPSGRIPRAMGGLGPVFDGEPQLITDGHTVPTSVDPAAWTVWTETTGFRARIGVPLRAGGRIVGGFFAASVTPGRYTDEHVATYRRLADLIGPLVENVVLLHRERRRRERLQTVSTLGPVLGASLRVGDVLERLGEAVRPAMSFDLLGLSRLGSTGREFERIGLLMEGRRAQPATIVIDESSFLAGVREGHVVLVRAAPRELDRQRPVDRQIIEAGIRSLMLVPLVFGEQVVGALFFGKHQPNWYDENDVEIVKAIAGSLVLAVQHQRLAEEQQRVAVAEATAQQLEQRVKSLRGVLVERFGFDTILGRSSPAFLAALGQAKKVAPTDTTVC
jgi:GAF domain-containing protein